MYGHELITLYDGGGECEAKCDGKEPTFESKAKAKVKLGRGREEPVGGLAPRSRASWDSCRRRGGSQVFIFHP